MRGFKTALKKVRSPTLKDFIRECSVLIRIQRTNAFPFRDEMIEVDFHEDGLSRLTFLSFARFSIPSGDRSFSNFSMKHPKILKRNLPRISNFFVETFVFASPSSHPILRVCISDGLAHFAGEIRKFN